MVKLSTGDGQFQLLPVGEHILKVTKVEYKEKYGSMILYFENKDGIKHQERYKFMDTKKKPVQGAINAFSYTAKVLMHDFTLEEINEQELVGKYLLATIEHTDPTPSKNDPTRMVTFARIDRKAMSNGWDEVTEEDPDELDDDDLEDDIDLDEEM